MVRFAMLAATFLLGAPLVAQERRPNNALFEIAAHQVENGKVSAGLHLFRLSCYSGDCHLTKVSLNQCNGDRTETDSFYPRVEQSSTESGTLKVIDTGESLEVIDTGHDVSGDYTIRLRMPYAQGRYGKRLTGFSGALVKNSEVLKRVVTVQYEPLPRPYQVLPLDCGVLLPGLPAQ